MVKSKRITIIKILIGISLALLIINIISRLIRPAIMGVPTMMSPSGIQLECCIATGILSITLWKQTYKSKRALLVSILIPIINALLCVTIYFIKSAT